MVIRTIVAIAKALSDPHRVRALIALRGGELCVRQIIELLELAPSSVSRHMTLLKDAGLVESRKDSRWVYYRLITDSDGGVEQVRLVETIVSLLEQDSMIGSDDRKLATKTYHPEPPEASCPLLPS